MSDKRPMLLIFAGPNGSGKSTITQMFNVCGEYTNADDIVKTLGVDNLTAAQMVEDKRHRAVYDKRDLTFETVLSSDRYVNLIKDAYIAGYFIKVVFVITASSKINISRVKVRVHNGGHDVPEDKIVSRYEKSLRNISRILQYCDIMHIYDNTESAVRIFRKHNEEPYKIIYNKYWSKSDIKRLLDGSYDFNHVTDKSNLDIELPDIE